MKNKKFCEYFNGYMLPVYLQYNRNSKYNNNRGGNDTGLFNAPEYRMWLVNIMLTANTSRNRIETNYTALEF